ncbi:MAG TPA: hypothetical protein VK190_04775 [Pseudoneobacillus sp.]|nr:hypothetical protein [Pseudoneobacillus sp.]
MFIKLTKKSNYQPIYVNINCISSVALDGDGSVKLWLTGDSVPFVLKETLNEVLNKIGVKP